MRHLNLFARSCVRAFSRSRVRAFSRSRVRAFMFWAIQSREARRASHCLPRAPPKPRNARTPERENARTRERANVVMRHLKAMPSLWGRVLTGGHELPPSRVEVADGRIVGLYPAPRPEAGDLVVEDGWIAPGLIDLQVNGAGGADLTSAAEPPTALTRVAETLAQHGVTAFCPTVISSPPDVILDRLAAYAPQPVPGVPAFASPSARCLHRGTCRERPAGRRRSRVSSHLPGRSLPPGRSRRPRRW